MNADGSVTQQFIPQPQPQPQIRIVKMDGSQGVVQTTTAASHQPIRVLNADGTVSNLSGNVRVISTSNQIQPQQGRQMGIFKNIFNLTSWHYKLIAWQLG